MTNSLYMSSLLARLGYTQTRKTARSLNNNRKKSILDENICVECRASLAQALNQSRSYGDEGLARISRPRRRSSTEFPPFPPSIRHANRRQQREIHRTSTVRQWDPTEIDKNDFPVTSYPAQEADPWPSEQSQHAVREARNTRSLTEDEQLELWENFQRDDEGIRSNDGSKITYNASVESSSRSTKNDEMLDIDYKSQLSSALLNREPDMVIRCLFAALHFNDRDWLRELPATTFSEVIRVLEPRHFMSKLASVHRELSTDMARQLGIAPMREVVYEYGSVLKEIVSMRRGIRLTLSDYKVLLRGARDLGHQKFAHMLWNVLWAEGHTPDTKCYNLYMSSAVWNGAHSAGAREKVRVIDFNITARKKERPATRFRQYKVGAGGVREQAMTLFNEMLANNIAANEESFRILITAAAREGDLATMKSILKKVWNMDVDAILAGADEATILPKSLPTHSRLYPTPELLFVISHAFGINNDIPSALRIVDFVARHYQIPITQMVWDQLFEWTFVLAIDRHGTDKASGSEVGQLPRESVMSLWNTMTSDPYRISPTMGMYNALVKNLFEQGEISQMAILMVEKMHEGRRLYTMHRYHAKKMWRVFQSKVEGNTKLSRKAVEKSRHEYEVADLVRRRDLLMLKRWLRLLLATYRDSHRTDSAQLSLESGLPQFLWEWRDLAPTTVRYETRTGFLEFKIRSEEAIESFARDQSEHKSRRREELKVAERYVGERWVEREVRPTRRLLAKA